jgi:acyl-CoA thioester hydrolase
MSGGPARVTIRRLVEFTDTDASGHYQNLAVLRWIEAAEAVLHQRLGIAHRTFGASPRVRLEIDFRRPVWFLDEVDIELRVERVGRTSCTYGFAVRCGDELAAEGMSVVVHVPKVREKPVPWPEDLRVLLSEGGDRTAG